MTREEILDKAKACVTGQREQDYGKPEDCFQRIADLWNAYLGSSDIKAVITSTDVCMMMTLMKIARVRNQYTDDSVVDIAGYAACAGELWDDTEEDKMRELYNHL